MDVQVPDTISNYFLVGKICYFVCVWTAAPSLGAEGLRSVAVGGFMSDYFL